MPKLTKGDMELHIHTMVESAKHGYKQENGWTFSWSVVAYNKAITQESNPEENSGSLSHLQRYELGLFYNLEEAIYNFYGYAKFHGYNYKSISDLDWSDLIKVGEKYQHSLTLEEIAKAVKTAQMMMFDDVD